MKGDRKLKYCPSCGSDRVQVEGARGEGRMAHCFQCGWGNWANRLRSTIPVRVKPPCPNLEKVVYSEVSWGSLRCKVGDCIHPEGDKTVSCFLSERGG